MSNKTIDSGRTLAKIILALIPLVLFTIGIFVMSGAKEVFVKEQKEIVRPGYESVPHQYVVEASYSKAWNDGKSALLIVLALVVSVAGTYFYIDYIQKQDKKGSILIIGLLWVMGALLIFLGPLYKWSSSSYTSTLSEQEYEKYKGDLDAIFPAIEAKEK